MAAETVGSTFSPLMNANCMQRIAATLHRFDINQDGERFISYKLIVLLKCR